MQIRFATTEEIINWNNLIIKNPDGGNIFQAKSFAEIKSLNNWSSKFVVVNKIYVLVLERKIPLLGKFWYVPKGPGVMDFDQLKEITKELSSFANENGVFLVRLEPELLKNDVIANKKLARSGLILKKGVQIPNTINIDITQNIDDIIAGFSSKTRYNIRAARKAGVTTEVVKINDKSCAEFYKMMQVTVAGKAFLRKFDYFKRFWEAYSAAGTGFFIYAKYGKETLAMDFITILGSKAVRKDAASPKDRTVRGSTALLEVAVIEYLKEQNIIIYDLCGCPPSDQIKNPNHPLYGVGVFKTGFSLKVIDYIGCLDLVINKKSYKLWDSFLERIFVILYFYIKKDLYY